MKYTHTTEVKIGNDVRVHSCGANDFQDFALLLGKMLMEINRMEMEENAKKIERPSIDDMLEHLGKVGLVINIEDLE